MNHVVQYSREPSRRTSACHHTFAPLHLTLKFDETRGDRSRKSEEEAQGASRLAIVRTLLGHGASPSATMARQVSYGDRTGCTPLHMAAEQTSHAAEMLRALLEAVHDAVGAEGVRAALDSKSAKGMTPLRMAATREAAEALLEVRARLNVEEGPAAQQDAAETEAELQKARTAAQEALEKALKYPTIHNKEGKPEARIRALINYIESRGAHYTPPPAPPPPLPPLPPPVPACGGSHLGGSRDCSCRPGPNEVCWGYRGSVKGTCPRCLATICNERRRTTAGCRMNGDAYGWNTLECEAYGLMQKDGWDEA